MQARKNFVLADYHINKDYVKAVELLETVPDLYPLLHAPEVRTISLVSYLTSHVACGLMCVERYLVGTSVVCFLVFTN